MTIRLASFLVMLVGAPVAAVAQDVVVDEPRDAVVPGALAAANQWLALVDSASYAASWDSAASLFRGAVDRAAWAGMVSQVRQPLGVVTSREVRSTMYTESLPGAPSGRYVVIQFETVFEKEGSVIETVTPMIDDGSWRVSGYYVRPVNAAGQETQP